MKKTICLLLCAVLTALTLAGCSGGEKKKKYDMTVVTTIFPIYDWVKNVLGERADAVDIKMLLDKGVDLHNFQASADDIVAIADCDLFIYVGGESDDWVGDVLDQGIKGEAVNLMDALSAVLKEERPVNPEDSMLHEDEGETEYDEHIWLSLKNAVKAVEAISAGLQIADPDNASAYAKNAGAYTEKLTELHYDYDRKLAACRGNVLVFADRYPFAYMADDYGLDCYAAFRGCSAETEASFETLASLAGILNEYDLDCVMKLKSGNEKIADTVIEQSGRANVRILSLDSMQSTTADDVANGADYLEIMKANLDTLVDALG